MRIFVLSDIHANLEALEACLKVAPSHDVVVNLGDIVGYGANPNEVVQRSRQLGRFFVRGNHDKACAGMSSIEEFNPVAGLAVMWTRSVLTSENLKWLRQLPAGPARLDGINDVLFVHGSPVDEDEYLLLLPEALVALKQSPAPLVFIGHTHLQGGFLAAEDDAATIRPVYRSVDKLESFDFPLDRSVRYLINPGSVGQPRDGDWRAAFALFDTDSRIVTYYRVPYDVEKAMDAIIEAELPERLATRLTQGR